MIFGAVADFLDEYKDEKYKAFHSKLIPTVDADSIIGVRVPNMRKFAKIYSHKAESADFMKNLPHKLYEENCIHAFLIEQIKDFDKCIEQINLFLPYIDNWATCDMMRPKCFKKNIDKLINYIYDWLKSNDTYTVRFAIGMLMTWYLDEHFDNQYLSTVSSIISEEYYINMMIAWYFATALAKQWNSTINYIEQNILSDFVHNKTIQKAIESYRITDEQKNYLRSLKRKTKPLI